MSLRIAQLAPLWENIPPFGYGGTERIVHSLTEGLVDRGFDVTLFACGTSKTKARLVSVYPRPLYKDNYPWSGIMYPLLNINEAFKREKEFDIIHIHLNKASDYIALPLARIIKEKVVITLHFPYPLSHSEKQHRRDRHAVLQEFKDLNYISISNSQRKQGENLHWIGTVYNGIDLSKHTFNPKPADYFLWLGKFNPDKGTKEAIMVAKMAGIKLLLAGSIDTLESEDYLYYETEIKPLIDNKQIEYVGEVGGKKKDRLLGRALALLNPIQWNEPFGLVMTEAMATGTPVISLRNGSASEIIVDGQTGFLVDSLDEMAKKLPQVSQISRRRCRERVEDHFTKEKMVEGYLELYNKLQGRTQK